MLRFIARPVGALTGAVLQSFARAAQTLAVLACAARGGNALDQRHRPQWPYRR